MDKCFWLVQNIPKFMPFNNEKDIFLLFRKIINSALKFLPHLKSTD